MDYKYELIVSIVNAGFSEAVMEAAKEAGAKYFLVEQDNASKHEDTLGQVKMSIDYITNEL